MSGFSGQVSHKPKFESDELSFLGATLIQVNHGLGRTPKKWRVVLRCKVSAEGFGPGDEVDVTTAVDGDSGRGYVCSVNSSKMSAFFQQNTLQNSIANTVFPTANAWRVVFYAW